MDDLKDKASERVVLERLVMCFLVSDCTDYEGCGAIAAFKSKEAAEAFVKLCAEYDKKCPECPDDEAKPGWNEYDYKYKKWSDSHPCGAGYGVADNYKVMEIPFHT